MTPTSGVFKENHALTYANYYKKAIIGAYNSSTISTIASKVFSNALEYFAIPLAAKFIIILAAIAVTTTPPGWVLVSAAVGSLVTSHLEIRVLVWATRNCEKGTLFDRWVHTPYLNYLKSMDHEFKILATFVTRLVNGLLGYTNHHEVWSSKNQGSIFQGPMPNRVSFDAIDLKKSNIQAVLSLHEDWELEPCMLSVPYKKEDWGSLGVQHKNIIPKGNILSDEDLKVALNFVTSCIERKQNVYIHGDENAAKLILDRYMGNHSIEMISFKKPIPELTSPISSRAKEASSITKKPSIDRNIKFHADGSFNFLDKNQKKKIMLAGWMNGTKTNHKAALEIIFKNKPNSAKLVSDCLSKFGQPLVGGKPGKTRIKLSDNITLVSYLDPLSGKILWKTD